MTVESLSHWFHTVADHAGPDAAGHKSREVLHRIEAALQPFLGLTLEAFAELLVKVKKPKAPPKPKKSDEEKAREKAEKAEAKRAADEAEKARKADEARQKKDAAAAAKVAAKDAAAAKKQADADAKLAKKDADAKAKVDAKKTANAEAAAAKAAKKQADADAKTAPLQEAAKVVADGLDALIKSFSGGGVPKATVDAGLATLAPLGKPQLLHVAKLLDADAGLTEYSTKPQIVKALQTMVLRVWKTSDNVNH